MGHIPLLRVTDTLGGLAMYYPFRVPLRSVIKDTLCIISYRQLQKYENFLLCSCFVLVC